MSDDELKNIDGEFQDDVDFIELDEAGDEVTLRTKMKKLRGELRKAEKERGEYLAGLQRERADFINYRKGEDEWKKSVVARAKENFASELLPVLDAYDLAFSNKDAWEKVDKNWRMGVEYIQQQLLKVLSENGIEEIQTKAGDPFDATIHEPMENIPTDDAKKDYTIAQVIQKGYKSNGVVLRPSRVKVYNYKG